MYCAASTGDTILSEKCGPRKTQWVDQKEQTPRYVLASLVHVAATATATTTATGLGRGRVDDLCGVEVGVVGGIEVGVVGGEDGVGVLLPLVRAAFAGFDEDEGEAKGDVFAGAGWDGLDVVEDGGTEELPSSHPSSAALHPRFSRTLMDSPFWVVYVSGVD
jgi:hypothetical protein